MRTKISLPGTLLLTLIGFCAARADDLPVPAMAPSTRPIAAPVIGPTPPVAQGQPSTAGLSDWITYSHGDCCGPMGANGPLGYELYLRTGPSLPVSGGFLHTTISAGWELEGGGRVLFFNPDADKAWTVDVGMFYIYNNGGHPDIPFVLNGTLVNVKTLHRHGVYAALGREWWLLGSARNGCRNWRFGFDVGAQWARDRVDLNEVAPTGFQRQGDVLGGVVLALHSDLEFPIGCCCRFQAGVRAEWDYNWMDPFGDAEKGNVADVNLLMTFGFRF